MERRSRSFDLPIDDYHVHVRQIVAGQPDADARPTIVFLHDSLGCDSVWRDFPDVVSKAVGCHALVYDRRGYGRSSPFPQAPRTVGYLEAEAIVLGRLLDACNVARAALIGHSDGGSIALLAAAAFPERIAAVVTEGAHVFVEELTLAGIRDARETLRTTDLRERLWRHHGEKTDAVTSAWIDVWLSPEFRAWNIESALRDVRCPTLVLQGVHDEFGTSEQVRAIVDGVQGPVDSRLVDGARHTPHREAREDTLSVISQFLRRALEREAITPALTSPPE